MTLTRCWGNGKQEKIQRGNDSCVLLSCTTATAGAELDVGVAGGERAGRGGAYPQYFRRFPKGGGGPDGDWLFALRVGLEPEQKATFSISADSRPAGVTCWHIATKLMSVPGDGMGTFAQRGAGLSTMYLCKNSLMVFFGKKKESGLRT